MIRPPERTRRHFPDGLGDPADPAARDAAIARLLEDGDRGDLAWLAAVVGAGPIRSWLARHAQRRLSRRSRAFWRAAAGLPEPPPAARAEELWPLA